LVSRPGKAFSSATARTAGFGDVRGKTLRTLQRMRTVQFAALSTKPHSGRATEFVTGMRENSQRGGDSCT